MKAKPATVRKTTHWETNAHGWQIRCLKCDFVEPWAKAGGRKYVFGRCGRCKRIRFRIIEQIPPGQIKISS